MGAEDQRHVQAALPPEKGPVTHCTGGQVGSMAGLDGCGKSRRHRDSIPGPSNPLQRLSYPDPYKCLELP